jgi:hypothetical protein
MLFPALNGTNRGGYRDVWPIRPHSARPYTKFLIVPQTVLKLLFRYELLVILDHRFAPFSGGIAMPTRILKRTASEQKVGHPTWTELDKG